MNPLQGHRPWYVISTPLATHPYQHSTPIHVAIVGATDFESKLPRKMVDAMWTALARSMATPSISPLAIATVSLAKSEHCITTAHYFATLIDPLKGLCRGASTVPSVCLGN
jgi:hypothetical protein